MHIFLFIIYAVSLTVGARSIDREEWQNLLFFIILVHLLFFLSFRFLDRFDIKTLTGFAVLYRLLMIGIEPMLSDDFYRFLWDGYLVSEGYNPFSLNPEEWTMQHPNLSEEAKHLLVRMNSPHYYSIYPSLLQFLFYLPWGLGIISIFGQICFLQGTLFLFELVNLFLLYKIKPDRSSIWLYMGNPLVIWEGVSQIHPEPILVTLLLCCILFYRLQKFNLLSFLFSLSLQVKMNLIFLLPGIFFSLPKRYRSLLLCFCFFSATIIAFTVFGEYRSQSSKGIGLFLHSFRFHSILESFLYYFLSLFDGIEYLSGTFSLAIGGCFYLYLIRTLKTDLSGYYFFGYLCLLVFSPVIHPWYCLPLVALAVERVGSHSFIKAFSLFSGLSYLFYSIKAESFVILFLCFELLVYIWILYGKKSVNHFCKET